MYGKLNDETLALLATMVVYRQFVAIICREFSPEEIASWRKGFELLAP